MFHLMSIHIKLHNNIFREIVVSLCMKCKSKFFEYNIVIKLWVDLSINE